MLLFVSLGLLLCFGQVLSIVPMELHIAIGSNNGPNSTGLTGPRSTGLRPGHSSKKHSCDRVRRVPKFLKKKDGMGLDNFYKKYTEAYKIPILSSENVPDDALKRACYIMRFLAADHAGVREAVYKNWGRVGVIATTEFVTSIPEHSDLDPVFWNKRARGLGGMKGTPISTAPEENILCYTTGYNDWYPNQDIMVHELNHGIHLLGAADAIAGWDDRLKALYNRYQQEGNRWANTYSMSTYMELFSEGTQSYFNVNSYSREPNGREGPINTREKLKAYDPPLYSLIKQVFPCGNQIIDRCSTSRRLENAHVLKMDCVDDGEPGPAPDEETCPDLNNDCKAWADLGFCSGKYSTWMTENCKKSCGICKDVVEPTEVVVEPTEDTCLDLNNNCKGWVERGLCISDEWGTFMTANCKKSCGVCEPSPMCADKNDHCSHWATVGHCSIGDEYAEYMSQNCKKSCNIC